jgi:hypothetical protein
VGSARASRARFGDPGEESIGAQKLVGNMFASPARRSVFGEAPRTACEAHALPGFAAVTGVPRLPGS